MQNKNGGAWRLDLARNSNQRGVFGAIIAWFISPGFKVVTLYRWSRATLRCGGVGKVISKLLWRWNVAVSGCYLSPSAQIAPGLALPHPVGVVVGDGVEIDPFVTLYQHVTLGRVRAHEGACPKVGEGAVIYAGAVVVGAVSIGSRAVIGANAVVTRDVPSGETAVGIPAVVLPPRQSRPPP
jgi:serine O-acetyltransferase